MPTDLITQAAQACLDAYEDVAEGDPDPVPATMLAAFRARLTDVLGDTDWQQFAQYATSDVADELVGLRSANSALRGHIDMLERGSPARHIARRLDATLTEAIEAAVTVTEHDGYRVFLPMMLWAQLVADAARAVGYLDPMGTAHGDPDE